MAIEVAAITAGPVKNLTAIANVATDFPQAMIFGCKAMNKPIYIYIQASKFQNFPNINLYKFNEVKKKKEKVPRLNMAIPRPASDNIDIDPDIIVGILMCHL